MMYLNDYDNKFPAPGSRTTYGFHPEDWIYWRSNNPAYPIEKSLIVQTSSADASLFRCPMDKDDVDRQKKNPPYPASYTFTSFSLTGGANPRGMSSIIDTSGNFYPFKQSSILRPSGKIMLAEGVARQTADDNPDPAYTATIDDGRWVPGSNRLTKRHGGKGVVCFADGHREAVTWIFAKDP